MGKEYTFRRFNTEDLGLVAGWLRTPEVSKWYPDADYIEDIEEQIEDNRVCQKLVSFNDTPIAYLQDYDIHGWSDHHLSFLPKGSRGLDTFIGNSNMIGLGHGTRYLELYLISLFEKGIPALGIDPNIKNQRAIRVYQKIGFQGSDEIRTKWGHLRILSCRPDTPSY